MHVEHHRRLFGSRVVYYLSILKRHYGICTLWIHKIHRCSPKGRDVGRICPHLNIMVYSKGNFLLLQPVRQVQFAAVCCYHSGSWLEHIESVVHLHLYRLYVTLYGQGLVGDACRHEHGGRDNNKTRSDIHILYYIFQLRHKSTKMYIHARAKTVFFARLPNILQKTPVSSVLIIQRPLCQKTGDALLLLSESARHQLVCQANLWEQTA